MNKFEEYLSMAKISDFIHRKELEDEKKKTVCLVFAIIAGIAAIAAIAFGIYKYLSREDDVDDFETPITKKPYVIMVVGVNGVGKTTTIGKLAYQFKKAGKSVYLGAADTFRAAAIEQLTEWAGRTPLRPRIKMK